MSFGHGHFGGGASAKPLQGKGGKGVAESFFTPTWTQPHARVGCHELNEKTNICGERETHWIEKQNDELKEKTKIGTDGNDNQSRREKRKHKPLKNEGGTRVEKLHTQL
eukprot:GHVT01067860.1.p1 GENE.GHVT01067860.1~~GHVT01067860.1.p1  ORF type:complete len:109 (+),score=14.03 GHVT01067860.1:478-804(+)